MNNFLIIQLRQVGDVVLTTPIARIIKEKVPESRVTFLTEASNHHLLEGNPFIDQLIISNRKNGWLETLKLSRRLQKNRFDILLDFMANPRSAVLAFLSRTPIRISYFKKGRGRLYTHQVTPGGNYAVDYKKNLLKPLEIRSGWNRPEIFLTDAEKTWGKKLREKYLHSGLSRLITVDPSHRRITRCWPDVHYGELCKLIAEKWNALSMVLWGPGEAPVAGKVASASQGRAIVAPATDLRESAALIAAADLHVGNCSAPRHISVAMGTPSFIILGSTSKGWTFPAPEHISVNLGLECQPCNKNECPDDCKCLQDFSPSAVFHELCTWAHEVLKWN